MLKKLLYIGFFILCSQALYSQTIVGTTPENKKVILEEFTGINCQFCPDGHVIAQSIQNNNPGEVFLINIHVGGFANPGAGQPDFRTPFGTAINNQAGVLGYPAGTVNRQVFPGWSQNGAGGTAMSRNFWAAASNQVLGQPAYVNMGVEAVIDVDTNELTVHVEAYYTGNSPQSTNKLNVALLQNNTLGPQSGGGQGNNYNHMHRLVHMLTGQWGVDINTTTTGSFVDETFVYTIPAGYNNIPVEIADLEIVVFMTETTQIIASGNGAYPTYTGIVHNNDAFLRYVEEINDLCTNAVSPTINIQNNGIEPLSTLEIEYSINSGTIHTYTWNGNLTTLQTATIALPEVNFDLDVTNTLVVSLPDDDNNSNNVVTTNFNATQIYETNQVELSIQLDQYPQETAWNIRNSAGSIVHIGGPYPGQANQLLEFTLDLTADDCYTFTIFDSFGDGICCGFGNGFYILETSDGTVIAQGGEFLSSEGTSFSNYDFLSSNSFEHINEIRLYPNPSMGIVNVQTKTNIDIDVFDITGKLIHSAFNVKDGDQINLSNLKSGLYLVKLFDENSETTQKIIIK